MAQCECLSACPFFNDQMTDMPTMSDIIKKRYCLGDNRECARYVVFKARGKSAVPADLFPSQIERAEELVGA